jgi:cysteine desulfurase
MIYLDNASTTIPSDQVCRMMNQATMQYWANPSSSHSLGKNSASTYDISKRIIANSVQCLPQELIITSGATESINTILKGFFEAYPHKGKHIITSSIEHSATLMTCKYLEERGFNVTYLSPGPDGELSFRSLGEAIRKETSLLSFLHVNNETGTMLDIDRLIEFKKKHCPAVKIHIDSAQSLGKIPFEYGSSGVDYASFSAHKIHGPKGIGMIFKSASAKLLPLIHGGGQESGMRSGTMNTPAIVGFATAIEEAYNRIEENFKKVVLLKSMFLQELKEREIDFICISPENSSPYILSIAFRGVKGEALARILEEQNIYISTSSACSSKKQKTNRIHHEMNIDRAYINGAIRISFCSTNTEDEIKIAVNAIEIAGKYFKKQL